MDYTVHEILQARILEWIAFPSPGDFPNPGIKLRSPTLQTDFFCFLPAEPQGKTLSEMIGVRNIDVLLTQCFMGRLEHVTKKGTSKRMPENRFFALTCLFGFAPLVSALWNHVDEGNSLLSLSVTEGIITLIIINLLQNCELDQIMENIYSS